MAGNGHQERMRAHRTADRPVAAKPVYDGSTELRGGSSGKGASLNVWQAIVLGLTQGLTEFLPVSSSAHLIIVPWLFGWPEPGLAFDAATHLGTLAAALVYFRREIAGMLRALPTAAAHPAALLRDVPPGAKRSPREADARLFLLIAVATIPGLVAGLLGQNAIEAFFHGSGGAAPDRAIVVLAIALMALAALLWAAERMAAHMRRIDHLGWRDAVSIGLAHAAAIIPGVSRSGATITAGLFDGLRRDDAARFSFLLGIPIIALAGLKGVYDLVHAGIDANELMVLIVGVAVSGLSGFAAIWGLLRYLRRSSTLVFVAYRFALGLLLILLVLVGK
jgi:undecaprenyl-diphosphatase